MMMMMMICCISLALWAFWLLAPCLGNLAALFMRRQRLFVLLHHGILINLSSQVRKTQAGIKHVLTERFYAWEDARNLAEQDPEVDLSGRGPAYAPGGSYLEGDEASWEGESAKEAETSGAQAGEAESAAAQNTKSSADPSTIPGNAKSQHEAPRA